MKKTLLLFYILFISITYVHSQSTWFWQQPVPTGNLLYGIDFVNEQTGYAVGTVGTIIKTTNGGNNWQAQISNSNITLLSVSFINESTGYTCGGEGLILKTTNGGSNWISQISNTSFTLIRIDFINDRIGYSSGDNGTMLKTTNGGVNWSSLNSGTLSNLYSLSFLDSLNGVAGGIRTIIKTSDGGNSWQNQNVTFVNFFSIVKDIQYIDPNNIISVVDTDNKLILTTNGGVNWYGNSLITNSDNLPSALSFINPNTGFVINYLGVISKTTDAGLNWQLDSSFQTNDRQLANLWNVDFVNENTVYVSGGGGKVIKSTNAGNDYFLTTGGRTNLESNFFVNENTGYTVGFDGVILKTTDAGNNWLLQNSNTTQNLNDVFFVNSETGYVCGDSGVVMKTVDGGMNWNMTFIGLSSNLNGIIFTNDNTGFIAGSSGKILKTTNSGINWINLPNGANMAAKLKPIEFVNNDTGFVAGDQYLKTIDGGNSWTILSGSGIDIYFPSSLTGYRTGGSGIINKTTDAGINWIVQNGNISNNLNSIFFINNDNGYSVGNGGAITKTINGGLNWVPQAKISNNNLNSVIFINGTTGYIAGDFGTILKTTNGGLVFISSDHSSAPEGFSLSQNYPNPFNSSTVIKYTIKNPAQVSLKLYDIEGKEIEILVKEFQNAGSYEVLFDATELPTGVYYYSLFTFGVLLSTRKFLLIK
jgi:photosystem II stability/assembly factor-like uncharacterized protein